MSKAQDSVFAIEIHGQHPLEDRLRGIDFSGKLEPDEVLTGTPTVTCSPEDPAPTLTEKSVNVSEVTNGQGKTVPAGKAVLVRVANVPSDPPGKIYTLVASCLTSLGNTPVLLCQLEAQTTPEEEESEEDAE